MTNQPHRSETEFQIQKPCPKSWGDLTGDAKKRFCSECSLHVYNAAELARKEAHDLVASSSSRVCMRMQYDATGEPIFRDSKVDASIERGPQTHGARVVQWALSAAAGLLAACHGDVTSPTAPTGASGSHEPPSKMGKVCSTDLLGDVALPAPGLERLGEAVMRPQSAPDDQPEEPRSNKPE